MGLCWWPALPSPPPGLCVSHRASRPEAVLWVPPGVPCPPGWPSVSLPIVSSRWTVEMARTWMPTGHFVPIHIPGGFEGGEINTVTNTYSEPAWNWVEPGFRPSPHAGFQGVGPGPQLRASGRAPRTPPQRPCWPPSQDGHRGKGAVGLEKPCGGGSGGLPSPGCRCVAGTPRPPRCSPGPTL